MVSLVYWVNQVMLARILEIQMYIQLALFEHGHFFLRDCFVSLGVTRNDGRRFLSEFVNDFLKCRFWN